MAHIIEVTDLHNFESKTQIAGAFGQGEHKSLNIRVLVNTENIIYSEFIVERRNSIVFRTKDLKQAIEFYNSL